MNETNKQFTAALAKDLKAALQSQQVSDFVEKTKATGDDRTFEVVMSTSDEDRQGDALNQSGWDLKYYVLNPVVLWAHNYSGFPIGVISDIQIEGDKAVATGKFAPEGVNPEADLACALYQEKVLRAVSPGYIQNDDGTRELLEVSFCPVPAGRYALSLRQVARLGVSTRDLVTKGFFYAETKGAVPYHDYGKADPDTAWDGPAEVKEAGEDFGKLKKMCAWYDAENPDVKSSYKLPHHEASGLKAVWKGVAAAMGALKGSRGGVNIPEADKHAVYEHLAKHYKEFDKEPPDYEKAVKAEGLGDSCEMEDGSPGVLAEDPKEPSRLVCVPAEGGKSKSNENDGDMNNELIKSFTAEHKRHAEAVADDHEELRGKLEKPEADHAKAIDEFKAETDSEHENHLAKTLKAIDDNYDLEDQAPKKSIDEFKKDITNEHAKHVRVFHKAIDEFTKDWPDGDPKEQETKEARTKAIDEFEKSIGDELIRHKTACEAMVKDEMGNDQPDEDEEKAIAFLAQKIGRQISAKNKEKIKAIMKMVEDHHNDVIAALKDLHGPDAGNEPEEQPEGEEPAAAAKSKVEVPAIRPTDGTFEAFMVNRRVLRTVDTAVGKALEDLNKNFRTLFPDRR